MLRDGLAAKQGPGAVDERQVEVADVATILLRATDAG
jgi:hypothetical protein